MVDQMRFADFARIGSDWFWETDCDDRFTYFSINRSRDGLDLAIFLGRTRRELATQDPENAARVAVVEALVRERQPFRDMLYRTSGAGSPVWCAISGEPRFDAAGVFVGYRGVGRDMSALVDAQAELERKSRALDAVLEAMPDGVHVIDRTHATIAINDQLFEILDLADRGKQADSHSVLQLLLAMAKRGDYGPGDPLILATNRFKAMRELLASRQSVSYQRQLPSGRWIEGRLRPVDRDGMLMLYRDITDDKRREGELERQSLLLQTIFAHFPGGIAVFDKDLRLAAWNESYAEIIGADPAAVRVGATPLDILTSQARLGEFGPVDDPDAEARRRWELYRAGLMDFAQRERPNGRTFEMRGRLSPAAARYRSTSTSLSRSGRHRSWRS